MLCASLLAGPFGDPEVAALFSDEQCLQAMLQVEAALARAEAGLGLIPEEAAAQIAALAATGPIDLGRLQASVEGQGFPVVDLVQQLRQAAGEETAAYVHRGATTQDIIDTARVLQMRAALTVLERRLDQVLSRLAQLAERHRHTLMAGRTHSQQALPIPLGLKIAGWIAPLGRDRERLAQIRPRLLVVQLGGAAGTLASLGRRGAEVQAALAAELGLAVPAMPWHTQRDAIAEIAGWLSLLTGSLAKIAQDVILLAQSEVGEVRESTDQARGGSSTMPQKSNPIASEAIVGAARLNAALLAAVHQAMVQEHERGTHGWQVELVTLPQMAVLTAAALRHAVYVSEHLEVDVARMRANVAASHGLMMGEAVSVALTAALGQKAAGARVAEAVRLARSSGRHLVDVVREQVDLPLDWAALKDESQYFGSSDVFIDRVLAEVRRQPPGSVPG